MNLLLTTILATTLVGYSPFSLRTAGSSVFEPNEQSHYPAHVTIDTTGLQHDDLPPEDVKNQQHLFERDLPSQFLEDGLPDAQTDDAAQVRVLFRWDDFAEYRYAVTFEVTTPDGRSQEHSVVFQGEEHDLLDRLKEEVPAVIALLERPPAQEGAAPITPPPVEPETPAEPVRKVEGRALLWTGVGLSVVGAGLVPAGVVLHMQTDQTDDGLSGSSVERRNPVALTGALIGVGAVALGAGVALIVIGAKKGKSSKKTAQLAPSVSPTHVGLSFQTRF